MTLPAPITILILSLCACALGQELNSSGNFNHARGAVRFRLGNHLPTVISSTATVPPLHIDPQSTSARLASQDSPGLRGFPDASLSLATTPAPTLQVQGPVESEWSTANQFAPESEPLPTTEAHASRSSQSFATNQQNDSTTQQLAQESDCCLPRVWASANYVLWFPEGAHIPALVTTSLPGTSQNQAGRLNLPPTSVLFGQEELNGGSRSGARFHLGGWINQCSLFGVELSFTVLGNDETRFSAADEFPILGRPFLNVLNGEQDAQLINFPGLTAGQIDATIKSEFYTGEALLLKRTAGWGSSQLDWYLGYRTARLTDDIRILESATVLAGPATGAQLVLSDQFRSRNTFHGVDLGVRVSATSSPLLELALSGKVAVGTTRSETMIAGFSRTNSAGNTTTSEVGFLTQPTNVSALEEDTFSTVTEFGVTGKRMFRPGLSLTMGYTLFFWHDIVRAGDLIDPAINTSQFPPGVLIGEPRPRRQNSLSNFWAHGFQVGFEYLF